MSTICSATEANWGQFVKQGSGIQPLQDSVGCWVFFAPQWDLLAFTATLVTVEIAATAEPQQTLFSRRSPGRRRVILKSQVVGDMKVSEESEEHLLPRVSQAIASDAHLWGSWSLCDVTKGICFKGVAKHPPSRVLLSRLRLQQSASVKLTVECLWVDASQNWDNYTRPWKSTSSFLWQPAARFQGNYL